MTERDLLLAAAAWIVAAHLRTILPPSAGGPGGALLRLLDLVVANYGSAKNKD